MARSILDSSGHASVAVEVLGTADRNSPIKDLYLPREILQGKSLYSIVRAARAALFFSHSKPLLITGEFPESSPVWLYWSGLAAWVPVLLCWGGGSLMMEISFWVWTGFFFLGFLSIPLERDMELQAVSLLKNSGHFEVDELVQLRKCLKGCRLGAFSIPFRAAAWAVRNVRFASASENRG